MIALSVIPLSGPLPSLAAADGGGVAMGEAGGASGFAALLGTPASEAAAAEVPDGAVVSSAVPEVVMDAGGEGAVDLPALAPSGAPPFPAAPPADDGTIATAGDAAEDGRAPEREADGLDGDTAGDVPPDPTALVQALVEPTRAMMAAPPPARNDDASPAQVDPLLSPIAQSIETKDAGKAEGRVLPDAAGDAAPSPSERTAVASVSAAVAQGDAGGAGAAARGPGAPTIPLVAAGASAPPHAAALPPAPPPPPPPQGAHPMPVVLGDPGALEAVALRVLRQHQAGVERFAIRLDPPDRGTIRIAMEFAPDGAARVVMAADSPQTLAWLHRHAEALAQPLAEQGLRLDRGGIGFVDTLGSEASGFAGSQQPGGGQGQRRTPFAALPGGWSGGQEDVREGAPVWQRIARPGGINRII